MTWLKENWFKLSVLLFLLWLSYGTYQFFIAEPNRQRALHQECIEDADASYKKQLEIYDQSPASTNSNFKSVIVKVSEEDSRKAKEYKAYLYDLCNMKYSIKSHLAL